jgi:hypothetical protein
MTPATATWIPGAALACCLVGTGTAHAAPAQATVTVKVVSASVPNGGSDHMDVKIAYTFPAGDPLVRVSTSGPAGTGSATGQATGPTALSVIVPVRTTGSAPYASATPVAVSAELVQDTRTWATASRTVTPG